MNVIKNLFKVSTLVVLLVPFATGHKSDEEPEYEYECAEYGLSAGYYAPGKKAYIGLSIWGDISYQTNQIQLDSPGVYNPNKVGPAQFQNDNRIKIEKGNSNNHVEISGFKLDNRLTIINIYNNPSSSLDLLKETLLEVKDYIDESEDILILGDFNHELKLGNQLESFMLGTFGTSLFSPRELTTNARTVIDVSVWTNRRL
ncbi:hypothetical protein PVAND_015223 [Polypedilum vanderplanki]|uniref:Endonuclease/exonuclease/phosphatase domain-containing protein n=1 Tax=Polypedilum vanderplanki TaxID=319348 RepID=A0A9J6BBJ2_POLVA|nr:hypothetical protein PVAND_015223 [Polypedilum vanderplanki]